MVNAQEWLDANYPNVTRSQITELDISNKSLEGNLSFPNFINLWKLNYSFNLGLESVRVPSSVTELDVSNTNRGSQTALNDSCNFRKLNYSNNFLTSLDVSGCSNLEVLNCLGNPKITNLSLPPSPRLNSFDCFGAKIFLEPVPTPTEYVDVITYTKITDYSTVMATAIPLGVLLLIAAITAFYYYYQLKKLSRQTNNAESRHLSEVINDQQSQPQVQIETNSHGQETKNLGSEIVNLELVGEGSQNQQISELHRRLTQLENQLSQQNQTQIEIPPK